MLWVIVQISDLLPFVWIALLVIAVIIVILGGMAGQQIMEKMTPQKPPLVSNIINKTSTLQEAKDSSDMLQQFLKTIEKLLKSIKLP